MKIGTTPGARCPTGLTLAVALVALVAVLAAGCSSDESATTTQAATTTAVVTTTTAATTTTTAVTTTTTEAVTTTEAAGKTPAATVDELVTALYAAINAKDSDAVWALHTDDASHPFYYVEGRTGSIADNIPVGYDIASDPLQGIEVLGEPLVSGDVVAVPVAYNYPASGLGTLTGFDVLVVSHVEGGLLVGGAATFAADDRPDLVADPAEAQALIAASAAAFNADDIEGMLANYSAGALFWEDMTDVDTTYRGTADIRDFFTANHYFTVGQTGDPVISGRFIAVPNRNTLEANGAFFDGMLIFWVSDGKMALQAYAQG